MSIEDHEFEEREAVAREHEVEKLRAALKQAREAVDVEKLNLRAEVERLKTMLRERAALNPDGSDVTPELNAECRDESALTTLRNWVTQEKARIEADPNGGMFDTGFRCVSEGGTIFQFDPESMLEEVDQLKAEVKQLMGDIPLKEELEWAEKQRLHALARAEAAEKEVERLKAERGWAHEMLEQVMMATAFVVGIREAQSEWTAAHWICAFCRAVLPNEMMSGHIQECVEHPMGRTVFERDEALAKLAAERQRIREGVDRLIHFFGDDETTRLVRLDDVLDLVKP